MDRKKNTTSQVKLLMLVHKTKAIIAVCIALTVFFWQRWSPRERPWPRGRRREQILKSLALASRPQVLEQH